MQKTRIPTIQGAIFAALGCTTIDRRSPRRMDESAEQIARFVRGSAEYQKMARDAGWARRRKTKRIGPKGY